MASECGKKRGCFVELIVVLTIFAVLLYLSFLSAEKEAVRRGWRPPRGQLWSPTIENLRRATRFSSIKTSWGKNHWGQSEVYVNKDAFAYVLGGRYSERFRIESNPEQQERLEYRREGELLIVSLRARPPVENYEERYALSREVSEAVYNFCTEGREGTEDYSFQYSADCWGEEAAKTDYWPLLVVFDEDRFYLLWREGHIPGMKPLARYLVKSEREEAMGLVTVPPPGWPPFQIRRRPLVPGVSR